MEEEKDEIKKLATDFANAFTKFSDIEGSIIRGHILVEKALNKSIEQTIVNPEEYNAERFTFSQKVLLGHMLGITNHFKDELQALNKLRNQIAHSLKYDDKYIDVIILEINKKTHSSLNGFNKIEDKLDKSISFMCGAITFAHENAKSKIVAKHLPDLIQSKKNNIA